MKKPIDWNAEEGRISEELKQKANDGEQWLSLMFRIGEIVNCLPSVYPDGNEHIVQAVKKLASEPQKGATR